MNKTETKVESIEGKDFVFHISYELKNHKDLIAYIKVKNDEVFKDFKNENKIIKTYLYNYLYTEIKKYFLLKATTVDLNHEFQGTFEIQNITQIPKRLNKEVSLNLNNQTVTVDLEIKREFEKCEYFEPTPFNQGDSNSFLNPIYEIYDHIVFIGKIRSQEDRIKVSNIYNSGEGTIYKCFEKFIKENFGEAFILRSVSQRSCSHFEVQIKYKIIPNI